MAVFVGSTTKIFVGQVCGNKQHTIYYDYNFILPLKVSGVPLRGFGKQGGKK